MKIGIYTWQKNGTLSTDWILLVNNASCLNVHKMPLRRARWLLSLYIPLLSIFLSIVQYNNVIHLPYTV